MTSVKYMGHILSKNGLQPDPDKVEAIDKMPEPENIQAVQRITGVINYLGRYIPNLSEKLEPLRSLTRADSEFVWNADIHGKAFAEVKQILRNAPVLKYFDSSKPTTIQCDSSQNGLGATLFQEGLPVAYASRALTSTEKNYAQIDKFTRNRVRV